MHLHETPLSADQKITPIDDAREKVVATVLDTPQLCWWLLGFGENVEVLKPAKLREELSTTAKAMAEMYSACRN